MDEIKGLDDATLKQMLENATSYEERSAIRKEIRERKKQGGGGASSNKQKGTSMYNRFAGGRKVIDNKTKSFVPGGGSTAVGGAMSPKRTESPSNLRVITPESPLSKQDRDEELKKQDELKKQLEEEEYQREEQKRKEELERQKEEERKQREEKELLEKIKAENERLERMKEEEERLENERLEREKEEEERKENERLERIRREKEEEERLENERLERIRREKEEEERLENERLEREEEEEAELQREEEKQKLEEEQRKEKEMKMKEEEEENERQKELEETMKREREEEEERAREMEEVKRVAAEEKLMEEQSQREEKARKKEKETTTPPVAKDTTDGRASPFGVQLKSRGGVTTSTPKRTTENNPEFMHHKLKKNDSNPHKATPPRFTGSSLGVNSRDRSQSSTTPTNTKVGGAPKTLADFQRLSSRNRSNTSPAPPTSNQPPSGPTLQAKLVDYVNASLELRPPLSRTGNDLYDTCRRPSVLCKLINKSVRNTVDMRALTKTPPPSASRRDKTEAIEENMTLVVESARSIGCSGSEDLEERLINGDQATIRSFLIQLIRARVVHLPGMKDEPSTSFEDFNMLMEKLGLGPCDEYDGDNGRGQEEVGVTSRGQGRDSQRTAQEQVGGAWREKDSNKLKEELKNKDSEEKPLSFSGESWREEKSKQVTPEIDVNKPSLSAELSYEERAALRRAEREKKRREREKLASGK